MLLGLFLSTAASAQTCRFGIYSSQDTNIRDRVQLSAASIGSNGYLEVGSAALINSNISSSGNVFLRDRCTVNGNVYAAGTISTQNQVTISGVQEGNLSIDAEAIDTRDVLPGTQDYTLYRGNNVTLPPGAYRNLHMHDGAVLHLSQGVYHFNKFVMEAGSAVLQITPGSGTVQVNVQNELRFGDRNQFVVEQGATPQQVQFYTNATQQVKVGTDAHFFGVITAPNAQIYVFSRCTIHGALYGKSIWIDTDTSMTLIDTCAYTVDFDDDFGFDLINFPLHADGSTIFVPAECAPGQTLSSDVLPEEAEGEEILSCTDDGENCETWTTWTVVDRPNAGECATQYCTPDETPTSALGASTPGCDATTPFVSAEYCPMLTLEDGTEVPADCGGLPAIPAVENPQIDPDCLANGGSLELCTLAAQQCITTTLCSDDPKEDRIDYSDKDPEFDKWTMEPETTPQRDTNVALMPSAYLVVDPCSVVNGDLRSSAPTVVTGFDHSEGRHFLPSSHATNNETGGAGGNAGDGSNGNTLSNANRWSWKKGSEKWGAAVDAGYTANVAYVKGLFSVGSEVGAGYEADASASVTIFGQDVELAKFNLANSVQTCDWYAAANLRVLGDTSDILQSEIDINGLGVVVQGGGNIAQADPGHVATCEMALGDFYDKTNTLLQKMASAEVLKDAWEAWRDGSIPDYDDRALSFDDVTSEYNAFANYYNTQFLPSMHSFNNARVQATEHDFSAKLLKFELYKRTKDIRSEIPVGPFDIGVSAGAVGTVGLDLQYGNEMEFTDETNFGYIIPRFKESVNAAPRIAFSGWALASASIDLGIVGGSVGIESTLDLVNFQLPMNASYEFRPEHNETPSGHDVPLLADPGSVDWKINYAGDTSIQLAMLSGRIDLAVRGWIRLWFPFKKIKLTKTWRKNITKWDGVDIQSARKSLYSISGSELLMTTPDIYALPNHLPEFNSPGYGGGGLGGGTPRMISTDPPSQVTQQFSPFQNESNFARMVTQILDGNDWHTWRTVGANQLIPICYPIIIH
jgi:hypothetical protein